MNHPFHCLLEQYNHNYFFLKISFNNTSFLPINFFFFCPLTRVTKTIFVKVILGLVEAFKQFLQKNQIEDQPPSTTKEVPVIYEDASEAKNKTDQQFL